MDLSDGRPPGRGCEDCSPETTRELDRKGLMITSTPPAVLETLGQRSYAVPIHNLATELFIKILKAVVSGHDIHSLDASLPSRYYHALYRLICVSKYWQEVICNVTSFWTLLDSRDSSFIWDIALARSLPRPLHVAFMGRPDILKSRAGYLEKFLNKTSDQMDRWEVVTLDLVEDRPPPHLDFSVAETPEYQQLLSDIETFGSFGLKSFRLRLPNRRHTKVLDLFQRSVPELSAIDLHRATLRNWSAVHLYGLRSLSLSEIVVSGPSLDQLTDVLRSSPNLQSLSLREVTILSGPDLPPIVPPIPLPHLRSLALANMAEDIVQHLLNAVQVESWGDFTFVDGPRHLPQPPNPFPGFNTVPPELRSTWNLSMVFLAPRFATALMSARSVLIKVDDDGVRFCLEAAGSTSHDLTFSMMNSPPTSQVLRWATRIIQSTPLPAGCGVTFDFLFQFNISARELVSRLWSLKQLEVLKIRCEDDTDLDEVVTALSTPRSADLGNEWLCPGLRELRLQNCHCASPRLVLRMVRERFRAGLLASGASSAPVALQTLEANGGSVMDEEVFITVDRIMPGRVIWRKATGGDKERAFLRFESRRSNHSGGGLFIMRRGEDEASGVTLEEV